MPILETRSEVKVKVTRKWDGTLFPPKMHSHTKFGISNALYKRHAPDMIILKKLGQNQGHSDQKMVCDTPPSKNAFTHRIWNYYIKKYKRYAPDSMLII